MKPSGAHTHPDSGSGIGAAAVVVLAAIVVASVAGPVVAAVAELVRAVLIAAGVVLGLAVAGGGALVVWRLRHRNAGNAPGYPAEAKFSRAVAEFPTRPAVPRRTARALPAPVPGQPAEVHLHFHGMPAEDVAAILRKHAPGRIEDGNAAP